MLISQLITFWNDPRRFKYERTDSIMSQNNLVVIMTCILLVEMLFEFLAFMLREIGLDQPNTSATVFAYLCLLALVWTTLNFAMFYQKIMNFFGAQEYNSSKQLTLLGKIKNICKTGFLPYIVFLIFKDEDNVGMVIIFALLEILCEIVVPMFKVYFYFDDMANNNTKNKNYKEKGKKNPKKKNRNSNQASSNYSYADGNEAYTSSSSKRNIKQVKLQELGSLETQKVTSIISDFNIEVMTFLEDKYKEEIYNRKSDYHDSTDFDKRERKEYADNLYESVYAPKDFFMGEVQSRFELNYDSSANVVRTSSTVASLDDHSFEMKAGITGEIEGIAHWFIADNTAWIILSEIESIIK